MEKDIRVANEIIRVLEDERVRNKRFKVLRYCVGCVWAELLRHKISSRDSMQMSKTGHAAMTPEAIDVGNYRCWKSGILNAIYLAIGEAFPRPALRKSFERFNLWNCCQAVCDNEPTLSG